MDDKKVRGARITISQKLFNDIVAKGLGFNPGEINVLHVSDNVQYRAFELTVIAGSADIRFPVVEEGCRFPEAVLDMFGEEDGTVRVIGVRVI